MSIVICIAVDAGRSISFRAQGHVFGEDLGIVGNNSQLVCGDGEAAEEEVAKGSGNAVSHGWCLLIVARAVLAILWPLESLE